jgi:hypothetical protein
MASFFDADYVIFRNVKIFIYIYVIYLFSKKIVKVNKLIYIIF